MKFKYEQRVRIKEENLVEFYKDRKELKGTIEDFKIGVDYSGGASKLTIVYTIRLDINQNLVYVSELDLEDVGDEGF